LQLKTIRKPHHCYACNPKAKKNNFALVNQTKPLLFAVSLFAFGKTALFALEVYDVNVICIKQSLTLLFLFFFFFNR